MFSYLKHSSHEPPLKHHACALASQKSISRLGWNSDSFYVLIRTRGGPPPAQGGGVARPHIDFAVCAYGNLANALLPRYNHVLGYEWDRRNVEFHQVHHERMRCNYSITQWLDNLLGTTRWSGVLPDESPTEAPDESPTQASGVRNRSAEVVA
jgi:hypothetical protein